MSVPRAAVAAQSIGAAFKGEASRALAARSVHVKIFPRVRNIHESCQILRQLQEFGDVEFYKNLANDPDNPAFNSARVIFSHPAAAERALNAVTIKFYRDEEFTIPIPSSSSPTKSSQTSTSSLSPSPSPHQPSPLLTPKHIAKFRPEREMTVTFLPTGLNHFLSISRGPYYSSYEVKPYFKPGKDLLGRVPQGFEGIYWCDPKRQEDQLRNRNMSEKMRERRVSERGWSGLRDLWEMGEKQPRSEQSNNGDKEMGMEEENS